MTKSKYFGDKTAAGYFTNPSTTSASTASDLTATVAPQESPTPPNPIEEALKSYTKSSHKLIVKRYAVKRG